MLSNSQRHHLDTRADVIGAVAGDDNDLLATPALAGWLGVSIQFLEIGRSTGRYGPPFLKISPRCVRYQRGAVRSWLASRAFASTAEYGMHTPADRALGDAR